MLTHTIQALQETIVKQLGDETAGIENAYGRLADGEILSIGITSKIRAPEEQHPDIELEVALSYVVEKRKIKKVWKIDEHQRQMEFKEGG